MSKNTVRIISVVLLLLSLSLWAAIIIPSFLKERQKTTGTTKETAWQEQPHQLSDVEAATMSASFTDDFEKNLAVANATPTPTVFFTANIPASMSGDIAPPTATIQGSVTEGAVLTATSLCFPLWVTDNMTPWQQLQTRAKLDSLQWSIWSPLYSYCFSNLGMGQHTVSIQIRDLAGNLSPEIRRTFTIRSVNSGMLY